MKRLLKERKNELKKEVWKDSESSGRKREVGKEYEERAEGRTGRTK